ncbi:uncharacterized protein METZ01_LOCUS402605, partial [marine metagenome]
GRSSYFHCAVAQTLVGLFTTVAPTLFKRSEPRVTRFTTSRLQAYLFFVPWV